MPSKIQLDVNLWFLYLCLQKSDYKTIDFNAVGSVANLKPPAARMRFTRLRKQIESGSLTGTQSVQESSTTSKKTNPAKAVKKEPRNDAKKELDTKADMFKHEHQPTMGYNNINEIPVVEELDFDIKMEMGGKNDRLSDSCSLARLHGEGPGAEDNDEDVPLAKKRKMAAAIFGIEKPPSKPSLQFQEKKNLVVPGPQNRAPLIEVKGRPPSLDTKLTPWGPVGPAGMHKKGGRPATYDANKLAPPMDDSPKGLGPHPTIMSDNPSTPCDPVVKNSHLCNPDIPAIKITDLDPETPTSDSSKESENTLGTVEERINKDLFGPNNAHLWLPKKRDPVITLPPGRSRMEVPVFALIEEHERRLGNGKKS